MLNQGVFIIAMKSDGKFHDKALLLELCRHDVFEFHSVFCRCNYYVVVWKGSAVIGLVMVVIWKC